MTHFIGKEHAHAGFSSEDDPVLVVSADSNETICFETSDEAYAEYEHTGSSENLTSILNPITGPVYVDGAHAGDTLTVDIVDIELGDFGWSAYYPNSGAIRKGMGTSAYVKKVPIKNGLIHLTDSIAVEPRPMVGCFGTAPSEGRNSSMSPVFPEGGNLDLTHATVGTRLYLPVRVEGAYLGLGDVHAIMAEGEASDVAIEAAGKITVKVGVTTEFPLDAPALETESHLIFVGLGDSLQQSLEHGYLRAFNHLTGVGGYSCGDAFTIMSALVDSAIGGPAGSATPPHDCDTAAGAITTHHVPKHLLS